MINDDVINALNSEDKKTGTIPKILTILPLRDTVIYPNMIFPVLIGRNSSLKAVGEALNRDKFIFLSAQKNSQVDEPSYDDIYRNGTTAKIIQVLRLPNNLLKVLVEGIFQSRIKKIKKADGFLQAELEHLFPIYSEDDPELQATIRHTSELFAHYVKSNHNLPPDLISAYDNLTDPFRKLFFASANIQVKVETKQKILEIEGIKKQFFELSSIIGSELDLLKLEQEVNSKVQD